MNWSSCWAKLSSTTSVEPGPSPEFALISSSNAIDQQCGLRVAAADKIDEIIPYNRQLAVVNQLTWMLRARNNMRVGFHQFSMFSIRVWQRDKNMLTGASRFSIIFT